MARLRADFARSSEATNPHLQIQAPPPLMKRKKEKKNSKNQNVSSRDTSLTLSMTKDRIGFGFCGLVWGLDSKRHYTTHSTSRTTRSPLSYLSPHGKKLRTYFFINHA
ncbi:hypothetical protein HW260_10585 [Helicobacter cinaedi]|uniref:hypothetical protein n=1 Tax=Helicobacter cinaedi TaxID=213 RepID=UPI0010581B11|nr:hypothetical protein [Helicobacter cinaedi]QOQ90640.1 hypothetical protein HW260_10585 [Helicobacter cinaedi]